MNIESKFLFISRIFILVFLTINIVNFIPFDLFEVSYYFNFSTIILDTSTLLILGLGIPKFIYLKSLNLIQDGQNSENIDSFKTKVDYLNKKIFDNSRISFLAFILFVMITIMQPFNLIFALNDNDIYSSAVIQSFQDRFNVESKNLGEDLQLNNNNTMDKNKKNEFDKKKSLLKQIEQKNISEFLKMNNKKIFSTVKLMIRNIVMSLIWSIAFYKLSKIKNDKINTN